MRCWPRSATGHRVGPNNDAHPHRPRWPRQAGSQEPCPAPVSTWWSTSPTTPPQPRPRPPGRWGESTRRWWQKMSEATLSRARTQSEAETYQRLRAHLGFLKLPDAAEALPRLLDEARMSKLPLIETLEALLGVEVAATEERLEGLDQRELAHSGLVEEARQRFGGIRQLEKPQMRPEPLIGLGLALGARPRRRRLTHRGPPPSDALAPTPG